MMGVISFQPPVINYEVKMCWYRVNGSYCTFWYIDLQAIFILQTILRIFLLFVFVWNKIFRSKTLAVFYIFFIWFE